MAKKVSDVDSFLLSLASESQSTLYNLELRLVRKKRDRTNGMDRLRKQKDRMIKLAADMKATESNLSSICEELKAIEAEIQSYNDKMDIR